MPLFIASASCDKHFEELVDLVPEHEDERLAAGGKFARSRLVDEWRLLRAWN